MQSVSNPVVRHTITKIGPTYYVGLYDINNWFRVVTTDDEGEIPRLIVENDTLNYKINPHLACSTNDDFDDFGRVEERGEYFGANKHDLGHL